MGLPPGTTVREVSHSHKCRKCGHVYRHRTRHAPGNVLPSSKDVAAHHHCPKCGTVNTAIHEQVLRYERKSSRG